ncbi:transposable element Tc1 transposase [Trichonephila clavipes]|nr:transposable element Tc1 transposase [Trichonephila clavipes]
MSRSAAAIRRGLQEWLDNGRFQRHDGSCRPIATADREDGLSDQLSQRLIHRFQPSDGRPSHKCWNNANWGRIVFSEEFRFQLWPDDHRRRVWKRPGQRADPAFPIERHADPQTGVMVWGAISFDSQTPLVVIRNPLTAQRFVDDILRTVLLPFLLKYPGLISQ